jgi:hypothetical protein
MKLLKLVWIIAFCSTSAFASHDFEVNVGRRDRGVDFKTYCLEYVDKKEIECDIAFLLVGYGVAECSVEVELLNRETGEKFFALAKSSKEAAAGTGIFQAVGGFVIDGMAAVALKSSAKKDIKRFIKKAERYQCE